MTVITLFATLTRRDFIELRGGDETESVDIARASFVVIGGENSESEEAEECDDLTGS